MTAPDGQAQDQPPQYGAVASSPLVNGDVKLSIGQDALTVTGPFDVVEVSFADVNVLQMAEYALVLQTDDGMFQFNNLGSWAQPFFDHLLEAYNQAVLKALFVTGSPVVTARGDWAAKETQVSGGDAAIRVYPDCVVSLPPDLSARRVPLAFVIGLEATDYSLTLRLDDGSSYQYGRLGYDMAPFTGAVQAQLRVMRDKTLAQVTGIDPLLSPAQASQLAKLLPAGAAAAMGQLGAVAPSFVSAVEAKLADSVAASSYQMFKQSCDPASISVGFRAGDGWDSAAKPVGADGAQAVSATDGAGGVSASGPPYLLWLVAPSPNGQYVAVEFAQPDAATFVYRTGGDPIGFTRQLSRALEAIDFHRDVIRYSDAELAQPGNASYRMAAKRTAALQFVRAGFVGRVIHSSPDAWTRNLQEIWSA